MENYEQASILKASEIKRRSACSARCCVFHHSPLELLLLNTCDLCRVIWRREEWKLFTFTLKTNARCWHVSVGFFVSCEKSIQNVKRWIHGQEIDRINSGHRCRNHIISFCTSLKSTAISNR